MMKYTALLSLMADPCLPAGLWLGFNRDGAHTFTPHAICDAAGQVSGSVFGLPASGRLLVAAQYRAETVTVSPDAAEATGAGTLVRAALNPV
jgi:hypothetical protein